MERVPEPEAFDEVGVVTGWLAFHRDALAANCEGLTAEQLVTPSAPPSSLTLLGLVRHLTEIERDYLVNDLSGVHHGYHYVSDDDPEADVENLDVSMVEGSMSRWYAERDAADALIARHPDFSVMAASGKASVRVHLLKVVQEYARHNGHADILRERLDGTRGE
jgi:hypothetical protein